MTTAKISGVGHAVPARELSNLDLEKIVDTSDEWIRSRTGIEKRRLLDPKTQNHTSLSVEAGKMALERAGLQASDIDYLICATLSPQTRMPIAATRIVDGLGMGEIGSFDLNAACGAWVYGLELANALVTSGKYKRVLLIATEILSEFVNWKDRNTCVLFGDGASATIIEADSKEESAVLSTATFSWPDVKESLVIRGGGSGLPYQHPEFNVDTDTGIRMNGSEVFKNATRGMAKACKSALEKAQIDASQISLFIPHQANLRIIEMTAKLLDFPMQKVVVNLQRWGNTSSASIPIALSEIVDTDKIKKGDHILFASFGAGYSFGAAVVRW